MKSRLYPNIKHLTTMFCAGILIVTVSVLALRLTLFSDMAYASDSSTANEIPVGTADGSTIVYKINPSVYFNKPGAQGNFQIENPETNNCYLTVNVTLDDDPRSRSVYYSGYISPGASKTSVRLDGDLLEEGIYECTATIEARDADDPKEVIATESCPITLYIGVKPS